MLAGHSAGAWASITLKFKYPKKINGVIAFNPAFAGPKKRRSSFWEDIRKHEINLIDSSNLKNISVFSHDKDKYEIPKTLSFLSESESVNLINLSNFSCKAKLTLENTTDYY